MGTLSKREALYFYCQPQLHLIFWDWLLCFSFSFSFSKENLWKSTGVQQAYQRRNEFQLADSAEYFLKNVTKYTADNFVPSDQDVLRTRIQTTGVVKVIYYYIINIWNENTFVYPYCYAHLGFRMLVVFRKLRISKSPKNIP